MAESRDLPGWPKKKLVTQVRRQLASFSVRPSLPRLWIETWQCGQARSRTATSFLDGRLRRKLRHNTWFSSFSKCRRTTP